MISIHFLFHLIFTVVVEKVKGLIEKGEYGRLFAVVHFAGHQWKVTNEDLILIENHIDAACGDRIRMEKVRPRLHVFSYMHYIQIFLQIYMVFCAAYWTRNAQIIYY